MADELCRYLAPDIPEPATGAEAFLSPKATFQEVFGDPKDAAATGLALSQLTSRLGRDSPEPLLWVQEARALKTAGRVFPQGLPQPLCRPVLHIAARNARDALWAMEEGLKCPSLAAVIGELHGNPRALDFVASRRLAVASERYGVPAFIIRTDSERDLSGARRRWHVASHPSLAHPHDPHAPGAPVWSLDLFRARDMRPGRWNVAYDRAAHRLDLVPAAGDGAVAQGASRYG